VEVGHRLTIRSTSTDPRSDAIATAAEQLGLAADLDGAVQVADVVFVDGALSLDDLRRLESLLVDPLLQSGTWEVPDADTGIAYEIAPLPGVTDTDAATVMAAAARLGITLDRATSARRVMFDPDRLDPADADAIIERVVANPIVERWAKGTIGPGPIDHSADVPPAETVPLHGLTPDALVSLGKERSLALDAEELLSIQAHFASIGREPTDVELETLAQTWSEHCAHKSFRAIIDADDGRERQPLLRALRDTTDAIDAPFVRSSFVGNAGIVSFSDGVTVALKAETHNHPSAVEPFGGANTGVGGVIRDVLGAGHRPIAITDILCFGHPDLPLDEVPDGSLHPRRIREGVIDGVADYGNKIGLPTVAGAILYDDGFTTNPLVFAGCIGTAAERDARTGPHPGDRVVVLGGRTGRDGIRGATFSSLAMDATTGEVAGASVQIGDPITEKLLIDVLTGAEHLYSAITDCGAGGLSSAIGEMAEAIGADVDLSLAPLKYAGLAPWEIWLSEAQERMVVAVSPEHLPALTARCERYGVELADLGAFTGDGRLLVRHRGAVVLELDTDFLHDGRPQRRLRAVMPSPDRTPTHVNRVVADPRATLLALLSHRNIASKAGTIHRYDHEIRGTTVVRPIVGRALDGPGDGVVLAEPTDRHGIAIGVGVNPWYGMHDPEAMARAVVDEAIRNVVAVGADPDCVALLDNFSWGDPRDPLTFGELVAAVEGCCAAAMSHRAPFVSGKDSLNNTYEAADGTRHAVPPTLVITAVAHVPDVGRCVTADLDAPGNLLVVIGSTTAEFAGSHLDLVSGAPAMPGPVPQVDPIAPERFRALHRAIGTGMVRACHDVSEGGFAVAVAEMCISGRLGAHVHTLPHPDPVTGLFSESTSRFIVEVSPDDLDALVETLDDAVTVVGTVIADPVLTLPAVGSVDLDVLVAAFNRERWS
jgi:phosphoribosylformylglycinamidine synthase subunit PurSL